MKKKISGMLPEEDFRKILTSKPARKIDIKLYDDMREEWQRFKTTLEYFLKKTRKLTITKPINEFMEDCDGLNYMPANSYILLSYGPKYDIYKRCYIGTLSASIKLSRGGEPHDVLAFSIPYIEKFNDLIYKGNFYRPLIKISTDSELNVQEDGKINIESPWTSWSGGEETEIKVENPYLLNSREEIEKLRRDFLEAFEELKNFPSKVEEDISIRVWNTMPI